MYVILFQIDAAEALMHDIQMKRVNIKPFYLKKEAKIEELMLWRNQDLNSCTLLHAVAYYGDGINLIDAFSTCEESDTKNAIVRKLVTLKDSDGDSCLHLASSRNNIEFLQEIFKDGRDKV